MRILLGILLIAGLHRAYAILPFPLPLEPLNTEFSDPEETVDPASLQGYLELHSGGRAREMELPHFENPSSTLGYSGPETFAVPSWIRPRVQFWKKIYAEYSSHQAVVHDAEYPELTYQVLDLSREIDPSQPYRKQRRAIHRLFRQTKQQLVTRLRILDRMQNRPTSIPPDLLPLYKKFQRIGGRDRFRKAERRIRAQIGQRDRIVEGFFYGGKYFPYMIQIFQENGIPAELTRLSLVESAFNLKARSKVGASGIWQFMRGTGKRFLTINRSVDERNDPFAATRAAAQLLRHNFEALEKWPLAITAYNHGKEGMLRAVQKVSSDDLKDILEKYHARNFGFASSNFYAEFLAILELEREYRKHFGPLKVDSPLQWKEFVTPDEVRFSELALACGMTEQDLRIYNLGLTDAVFMGKRAVPKGFLFRVPVDAWDRCLSGSRNISSSFTEPADEIIDE